jgi:hypothetical protein
MHCLNSRRLCPRDARAARQTAERCGSSLACAGGLLVLVWCGSSQRDAVVAPQHVDARRRTVKRLKQATGATRAALGRALGGVLMAAAMTITAGPSVPAVLAAVVVPPQAVEEEAREQSPDDWAAMLLSAAPVFSAPEPMGVGAVATAEDKSDPWFSAPVPALSMPEQQAMLEYLQGGASALSPRYYQLSAGERFPRDHIRALRAHRTHRGRK